MKTVSEVVWFITCPKWRNRGFFSTFGLLTLGLLQVFAERRRGGIPPLYLWRSFGFLFGGVGKGGCFSFIVCHKQAGNVFNTPASTV